MAYRSNNLSALAYAKGFTLWHYRTPDRLSDLVEPGYFSQAASMLRVGDFIFVNCGAAFEIGALAVYANADGVVLVAPMGFPEPKETTDAA